MEEEVEIVEFVPKDKLPSNIKIGGKFVNTGKVEIDGEVIGTDFLKE